MKSDYLSQVTVVIPVLNEREALEKVLNELFEVPIPRERIIIVDGHSTDGTDKIARKLGVKVVYQNGKGKADAVKEGLSLVETKYAVIMDGDYTYPARYIPRLLEEAVVRRCGEVIGARIHGRENIPLLNRLGNRIITLFFNVLYGTRLRDVLSGMYLVDMEHLRDATYEMKGFSIEVEIASHMAGSILDICEVPIEYRERLGEKKLKAVHGLKIAIDLLRLVWRYNPVLFIFMVASLLVIPGLALGAYVAYYYFFEGVRYHVKGIIAIVLTASGFNAFLLGVLSLYLKRMELRLRKLVTRK